MNTEHTKTPWKLEHSIIVGEGNCIAGVFSDSKPGQCEANAKFILRACNSHNKLLEACKKAVLYDKEICKCADDPDKMSSHCTANGKTLDDLYADWILSAKQAIAKAEGE